MLTKEECERALKNIALSYDAEYVNECNDEFCQAMKNHIKMLENLIEEHFEMLNKLKTGDLSDGYHTFNELYHHRAVLFSVIINQNKEIAWKSKKHHDGTMYDGMFIVGIDTPQGQYSYHYDIDPYWNMFECKELDNAPVWDGHEPKDIDRLLSIDDNPPLKLEELKEGMWIWDNKRKAKLLIGYCYSKDDMAYYNFSNPEDCKYIHLDFEENRFYRKEVQE